MHLHLLDFVVVCLVGWLSSLFWCLVVLFVVNFCFVFVLFVCFFANNASGN